MSNDVELDGQLTIGSQPPVRTTVQQMVPCALSTTPQGRGTIQLLILKMGSIHKSPVTWLIRRFKKNWQEGLATDRAQSAANFVPQNRDLLCYIGSIKKLQGLHECLGWRKSLAPTLPSAKPLKPLRAPTPCCTSDSWTPTRPHDIHGGCLPALHERRPNSWWIMGLHWFVKSFADPV